MPDEFHFMPDKFHLMTEPTHGQFINNVTYGAWGLPRQIAYGNGRTESVTYNARMRASHYEIPAVGGFGTAISIDYQYYDDGRLNICFPNADDTATICY